MRVSDRDSAAHQGGIRQEKKPNTKAHEHTRRDLVHREEANGSGSVWSTIVRSVFGVEGNFGSLSTQHIQPSFGHLDMD